MLSTSDRSDSALITRLGSSTVMPFSSCSRRPRRPPSRFTSWEAFCSCPGLSVTITRDEPVSFVERDRSSRSSFSTRCGFPRLWRCGFASTGDAIIRPTSTATGISHQPARFRGLI
jgi:hypothetical protein